MTNKMINMLRNNQEVKEETRVMRIYKPDVDGIVNYDKYDNSVTLLQYASGSSGINAQKANVMIYFTPCLSADFWMQSKKRIHRINQTKACFYYQLVVKNSIEEKIYEALARGEDFNDRLFEEYESGNG